MMTRLPSYDTSVVTRAEDLSVFVRIAGGTKQRVARCFMSVLLPRIRRQRK